MNEKTVLFGFSGFRKKQDVYIKDELAIVQTAIRNTGAVNFELHYRIYRLSIGAGNKDRYIVTPPLEVMQLGDNTLWITTLKTNLQDYQFEHISMHPPEKNIVSKIAKNHGIKTMRKEHDGETLKTVEKEFSEIIKEFIIEHENDPIFFKITTPVPKEQILNLTNKRANELLMHWLKNGYEKDNTILLINKAQIPQINPELVDSPKDVAPYQSHYVFISKTKTSKTTTAGIVGDVAVKVKEANLLGFATANEVNRGSLDGSCKTLAIDEVMEGEAENLYGKIFGILEQGTTEIRTGKRKITTNFFGAIGFLANSREDRENSEKDKSEQETLEKYYSEGTEAIFKLADFIKKITHNAEAIGSRIGEIVFSETISPSFRLKKQFTKDEVEALESISKTLIYLARENYTKLYYNQTILDWLNLPFQESYLKEIKKISNDIQIILVRDFVSGQIESFRHLRGTALKLAVVENIISIIKGEIKEKKLIKEAEKQLGKLIAINLKSFSAISKAISEDTLKDFYKNLVEDKPLHCKILVYSLRDYYKKNKENVQDGQVLQEADLKQYFIDNANKLNQKISTATIWERLFKNATSTQKTLDEYCLSFLETETTKLIKISFWKWFDVE